MDDLDLLNASPYDDPNFNPHYLRPKVIQRPQEKYIWKNEDIIQKSDHSFLHSNGEYHLSNDADLLYMHRNSTSNARNPNSSISFSSGFLNPKKHQPMMQLLDISYANSDDEFMGHSQQQFSYPASSLFDSTQSVLSDFKPYASNNHSITNKKRGGENDLKNAEINRFNMAKLKTTSEKLDFLIQLEKHIPENLGTLTENARNFVNICLPIIHCFHRHHNSDKRLFEETFDKGFAYTTFKKVHCNVLKKGYVDQECAAKLRKRRGPSISDF